MDSGIYAISLKEKTLYIGQSCNIPKRWRFHKWQLSKGIHANTYLQRLYNKNNGLEFSIIEQGVKRKNLTSREIYYIKKLKPLCNFVLPSENDTWLFSKERNKKISISHTGKPKSAEHKKNISLAKLGVNNPMYGKPAWNKGIGRYGADNPMYGKKHTEEYKRRMSISKGTTFDIELARKLRNEGLSYEKISKIVNAPRKRISKVLKWNP